MKRLNGLDWNDLMIHYRCVFEKLITDPVYLRNLDWGVPRKGHPEGTVRAHIQELEENLGVLESKLSQAEWWKLRILIHAHDTFKPEARRGVPISHPESHASLAGRFLESYCQDTDLLAMVQFHDEPFALWRRFQSKNDVNSDRIENLFTAIKDWNLFLAFQIIDGCTKGKDRRPLRWFFSLVANRVHTAICEADIF